MSRYTTGPPSVPLELPPREQWLLHHVLARRIEGWRRSADPTPAEAAEAVGALGKLEDGRLTFTPGELALAREALEAYRRRADTPPAEGRAIRRIVEWIDRARVGRKPLSTR